jgi:hypothetical protein
MSQARRNRTGPMLALLVILGLIAGAALGLLFGWVIMPVEYVDASIADLAPEYKDEYILLVATAYYADRDLESAQDRLAELELPNTPQSVSALFDRYVAEGRDEHELRAVAALADALGVASPRMVAYLPTNTPLPTDTPLPTSTPLPTDTPLPPTDTPPPTATDTPLPEPTATDTPLPQPSDTPLPPTNTPKPTKTPSPRPPTNTPAPTQPPTPRWTWTARLVGPGEDGQDCGLGNLQIRITVIDAGGNQIGGVWIYDKYSGQYQVTGNVDSPDWGPGETKFEYGSGGGGSLCVASGQGGGCITDFTRDMPCFFLPPVEDLYSSGYCSKCCEQGTSLERCQQLINEGQCFPTRAEHFSWRVVFQRNW